MRRAGERTKVLLVRAVKVIVGSLYVNKADGLMARSQEQRPQVGVRARRRSLGMLLSRQ